MKSVLVAEDHAIVRLGITAIIRDLISQVNIVETDNFDSAIQLLSEHPFELLVLDINIPGGNNLQMMSAVRLRQPDIRILIFSGYDEQLFGINYLQAGADGYLVKHAPEEEIRKAITTMMNNEKYLSEGIKEQLVQRISPHRSFSTPANPLLVLSGRETEVMHLLIKGTSVLHIAQTLSLQITTVSTYKSRIFEKLEISNIIELAEKVKLYSN
ncbi:LuxR family two component transcriptional regulator [Chitinophaga niastensis]|uniref:LuxR family two component transcriptional regulator n=1 Tax=Chitinophaga niastensis TaxID=536980 RepID=A0A2P8HH62_CHINA|nr:response regulator transcription factor [Chitinophaga niastensis]PSL45558.1 LuxR family two component transcriptional regulator [Chitinophaga niastensis]